MNLFYFSESNKNYLEEEFAVYQIDQLNEDILSAACCFYVCLVIGKLKDFHAIKCKYLLLYMKNFLILPHSYVGYEIFFEHC